MRKIIILFSTFLFFSCEKKELPVPRHAEGESLIAQIDMGSDYKNQIWFSLGQNKVTYKNLKTDWDICFDASSGGYHVLLNGSRAMRAYKTPYSSFAELTDTVGLGANGKADMPSGNLDSTAIGNWQLDNKVYLINRGYNEQGLHTGYYKLKITSVTTNQYRFEYGDVFDAKIYQGLVVKDDNYNFIGYSFSSHAQFKNVEPRKTEFDLCFTNYTHLFYDPLQYYQVTGVLCNTYKTRAMKITNKSFSTITLYDTLGRKFSSNRNVIGYEWKTFDLNTNLYSVDPNLSYILMDHNGYYYKLHFVDFYTNSGVKGAPKFEFKRL